METMTFKVKKDSKSMLSTGFNMYIVLDKEFADMFNRYSYFNNNEVDEYRDLFNIMGADDETKCSILKTKPRDSSHKLTLNELKELAQSRLDSVSEQSKKTIEADIKLIEAEIEKQKEAHGRNRIQGLIDGLQRD